MAALWRSATRSPGGKRLSSSGSEFIVSQRGDALTNYDIVAGCRELHVLRNRELAMANPVATDPTADLSILRLPECAADTPLVRRQPGQAG
jgi:S1-C subfamily serine protease